MLVNLGLIAFAVLSVTHEAQLQEQQPNKKVTFPDELNRQNILSSSGPTGQAFPPEFFERQFQYPGLNVFNPGVQPQPQPQVLYYNPGQPFLYRPGSPPPGNFLIPQPQPGPNIYFNGGHPQGPPFGGNPQGSPFGGYPAQPAFTPPIEKDAEEIPTSLTGNHPVNPTPVVSPPTTAQRPQKLETLDEPSNFGGEADDLDGAAKNPNPKVFNKKPFPNVPQLKPGQQFFILNGHNLFSNFPFQGADGQPTHLQPGLHQPNPQVLVYRQNQFNQPQQQHVQVQDLFQRNGITGQIADVKPSGQGVPINFQSAQENLITLNQPTDFRQSYFGNGLPLNLAPNLNQQVIDGQFLLGRKPQSQRIENPRLSKQFQQIPFQTQPYNFYPGLPLVRDNQQFGNLKNEEDDTVVIDAKAQNDETEQQQTEPAAASASIKQEQPALSQAEPSAIALAGVGGVASAAPRGTALTGLKGLAVSAPRATAVAGPSKEKEETKPKPGRGKQ